MVELFPRRLPRLRKIGINTTGLTPHRAIPKLTRIVEFCAEARCSSARASRSTASATFTTRSATSSAASTRPARRLRRCRRWPKHSNFQFGIAATIFATNLEDAQNILAWARTKNLDIVFNMLRFTDAC